jgi:serine/threonine-protein kinase
MSIAPGTELGAYRILGVHRTGGMGIVYKAHHLRLDVTVALKMMLAKYATQPEFRERLIREAKNQAKLSHPNIVHVYGFGEEPAQGLPYIVTQFIDGATLAERLGTPRTVREAWEVLRPIAAALDYAHAHDVLHRDVKPSNILLQLNGTPVLADFGIAKLRVPDDTQPDLTATHEIIGTAAYMPPEQALGQRNDIGPASDQYALAVVAYELLTGAVPFTGPTQTVLMGHIYHPVPPPRAANPLISTEAEAALLKALAKHPSDRFASVTAFIDALVASPVTAPKAIIKGPVRSLPWHKRFTAWISPRFGKDRG